MPKLSAISVTLVLHVTLCQSIRVPVDWNQGEVQSDEPPVDHSKESLHQDIPSHYFEYTAKKPQFAIDIAAAHNVQSPEKHYTSYPIRPYTGVNKPELGKHQMLNPEKESYYPYQRYVASGNDLSHVTPSSTAYDVYHPYKAEEPGLQEIYKDPVLDKIRNDLRDSKNRLQKYENDAGESDVSKEEYLESPDKTDHRYFPHKNTPSRYEIHRPVRRPLYYRPPSRYNYRENVLNQKLRHPWNQNYAKVTPMHYRPIKNHLHNLRQNHALKYDDENNEYPQLPIKESFVEKPDGYDIYEKGKDNFVRLRNNVDESINKAVVKNRPVTHENLELKGHDSDQESHEQDDDEFVPIKNYAQVRKTETTKHLPRAAAFRDAENFDEIRNAPRLREAVKSTKAQVVYSEEGYEDSAYDHAGEQKHASDVEGHGGYLKEHELSGGKYQTPHVSAKLQDAGGSEQRDKLTHAEKWKNDNLDNSDDSDTEEYSEDEHETSEEDDTLKDNSNIDENESPSETSEENNTDGLELETENNEEVSRNKREDVINTSNSVSEQNENMNKSIHGEHIVNKRDYKIPETKNVVNQKYPYYFDKSLLSKNSPLRYAENLNSIPNKTLGGTEFYDSRKEIVCPTIEEDVDPIPDKLKKDGNPDDDPDSNDEKEEFSQLKNNQRLEGLGDKIDCLKSKYFGSDPLDSPFFKEDIIEDPEPVTKPNINLFDRNRTTELLLQNPNKKLDSLHNNLNIQNKNAKHYIPQSQYEIFDIFSGQGEIPKKYVIHKQRKRRATPFIYEPYKIIREGQVAESKKTTTTNNISPLIKQLQSSRVVDKVLSNQNKDQITKRNIGARSYKDIGRIDREKQHKYLSHDLQETEFVDVSLDKRRGEPRYEFQHKNHKSQYTPVKNKKSISLDEYEDQVDISNRPEHSTSHSSLIKYPNHRDIQKSAASNSVTSIVRKSKIEPVTVSEESETESEEEYDESQIDRETEPEKEERSVIDTTTTTTTTAYPTIKEKPVRIKTTTNAAYSEDDATPVPILRLKTRFRNADVAQKSNNNHKSASNNNNLKEKIQITSTTVTPKLREKKKKLSKSTLVTDTKTYGEEDDDMRKEDIDALIGVKHDTDEYLPEYEKEQSKKTTNSPDSDSEEDIDEDYDNSEENEDDEEEEEDEDEEEDENSEESHEEELNPTLRHTTPEPTKRTLVKTTETTPSTTEINEQIKPIISRKKIEVHRELPVSKVSPNTTRFRQDIKEVEIIKTMAPKRRLKPQKNLEALDLYKDENLAKDVNKLGGVEIFKTDLDVKAGPRHGGNYRSIEPKLRTNLALKDDVESFQSQKLSELNDSRNNSRPLSAKRGGILRNNNRQKEAKTLDDDTKTSAKHEGNLNTPPRRRRIPTKKSEKIIELTENNAPPLQLHGGNLKARKPPNNERNSGERDDGNSEIVQDPDEANKDKSKRKTKHDSDTAALLLNTYARAAPMLTTAAPPYILDPSKRRYYYVDV